MMMVVKGCARRIAVVMLNSILCHHDDVDYLSCTYVYLIRVGHVRVNADGKKIFNLASVLITLNNTMFLEVENQSEFEFNIFSVENKHIMINASTVGKRENLNQHT